MTARFLPLVGISLFIACPIFFIAWMATWNPLWIVLAIVCYSLIAAA